MFYNDRQSLNSELNLMKTRYCFNSKPKIMSEPPMVWGDLGVNTHTYLCEREPNTA